MLSPIKRSFIVTAIAASLFAASPTARGEEAHANTTPAATADTQANVAAKVDAHAAPAPAATHDAAPAVSPDVALQALLEGNARFRAGNVTRPHQDQVRRAELAKGQRPPVIILACADSRVAPELVFDAGLGDVFVCRVAGNLAEDAVIGSIEYAAEHLGSCLVVVMGHQKCGAVTAAVDVVVKDVKLPGHLPQVVGPIKPAVEAARKSGTENLVARAIDENVAHTVNALKKSGPVLGHLIEKGSLKIVGGRYDLDTGAFTLIDRPAPADTTAGGAELVKPAGH